LPAFSLFEKLFFCEEHYVLLFGFNRFCLLFFKNCEALFKIGTIINKKTYTEQRFYQKAGVHDQIKMPPSRPESDELWAQFLLNLNSWRVDV
jgi:hypothetical protein